MFSDELVEQPLYEKLEGNSLDHFTKKDEVVTLADNRDVFLFDGRGYGQVSHKHLIDPQEVLAFAVVTIVG